MVHKLELFLLGSVILLEIGDFFRLLPGDLDYIHKLISLITLGYLFVKASLSTVLFGNKKVRFDIILILSYFLFMAKNITKYAELTMEEIGLFKHFSYFLAANNVLIEKYSFYLGALLILFIALYMAMKFEIKKPSFMAVLHETGKPPKKMLKVIIRFITILLVLAAFFVVVFNLAAEWLSIALDAPITIILILFYLFVIVRYHKKFHTKHFIYKVGSEGEEFYAKFIKMFHYKKTLYLGIIGLLALHLLTDVGNFIIPYLIGLKDVLYFGQLGSGHTPLIHLLQRDASSTHGIVIFALALNYLFNAISMLFLLLLPTFAWYRFFRGKKLHISRTPLALVFSSLLCFALTPAFFIKKISLKGLVGVDIKTQSILESHSVLDSLISDKATIIITVVVLSILVGLIIWISEFNKKIEKDIFIIAVLIGIVFFGVYIWYYFISLYLYYIQTIIFLFKSSEFLIAAYFILFAMITLLFYVGGYIFFVYGVFKKHLFKEEIFR